MADNKAEIRPLAKENYPALARFLTEKTDGIFSETFWLDRFEYWWDNNPAMNGDICRGWILDAAAGEIGGFLGNIPVKYLINRQEKVVCSVTSWYMAEEFKKRSLELLIPFIKQNRPLLDTTPTEKVTRILMQLGFCSLDKKWLKKGAIYPVNYIEFWNFSINKVAFQKVILFFLKIAGLFAIPFLKVFQEVRRLKCFSIDSKYSTKEIHRFDNSYSSIGNKLKERYPIMTARDEIALNWFFFGSKDICSSRRVIEIRKEGALIGYAAVKLMVRILNKKEYHYFELVDIAILEEGISAYFVAINGILSLAKKNKNKIAFLKINPFDKGLEDCLKKTGLSWRSCKPRFLYRNFGENNIDKKEKFEQSFYATPLDGDSYYFP